MQDAVIIAPELMSQQIIPQFQVESIEYHEGSIVDTNANSETLVVEQVETIQTG